MSIFYERFELLCKKHNISKTKVLQTLGLSKGNLANFKNGTVPGMETVNGMATLFGVTTDYLLGHSNKETSSDTLSPAEKEIMTLYHSLPEERKKLFLDLLKVFASDQ